MSNNKRHPSRLISSIQLGRLIDARFYFMSYDWSNVRSELPKEEVAVSPANLPPPMISFRPVFALFTPSRPAHIASRQTQQLILQPACAQSTERPVQGNDQLQLRWLAFNMELPALIFGDTHEKLQVSRTRAQKLYTG
jgi:hypothetical protein